MQIHNLNPENLSFERPDKDKQNFDKQPITPASLKSHLGFVLDVTKSIEPVPFQEQNKPTINKFSQEVYDNLPDLFKKSCQVFTDEKEKEVYLVGALGNTSGMLPNVIGNYGGNVYEANLYVLLLGAYGEGKSGLMYSRKTLEPIHIEKLERSKEGEKDYRKAVASYKKSIKLFEAGKINDLPDEPTPPPHEKLFISANSSKTAIIQLLQENGGRGIIFEAEADTLADALKQDYGNFSDVLRKAFGHEPISFYRRANNEDVEINTPCVSVVLSCTYDQLPKLIPSIENGLYSRFIYYCIEASPEFKNVFDKRKSSYANYFSDLGREFKKIYDYLIGLTHPLYFELQPHQEKKFLKVFQEQKGELREFVSPALGGTANRLGLICFRIAMQLSVLRAFEDGSVPGVIVCSDQDFDNAIRIIDTLKSHAISVYWKLPKPRETDSESGIEKDLEKIDQKKKCLDLHAQGMKYREIAQAVFGSTTKSTTVYRWVNGN